MARKPMRRVMISGGMLKIIARKAEAAGAARVMLELGGQEDLRGVYFHEADAVEWRLLLDPELERQDRARQITAREDQIARCKAHQASSDLAALPRLREGAIEDMESELDQLRRERL